MKKIKLLIVDDSAVVRNTLSRELSEYKEIEVVATAANPYIARDKIVRFKPDVLTLDVEMPRMDGITFLEKLMRYYPLPIIILSSLTSKGCSTALKALELGAVEVMHKPEIDVSYKLNEMITLLVEKIKAAFQTKYRFSSKNAEQRNQPQPIIKKLTAMIQTTDKIVAVGASTGGTEALRKIIPVLPPSFPGTLIAQHMPEHFTQSFADSLNKASQMEVREARDGDTIHPGLVLVAPGNYHMLLRRSGARYYVEVKKGPLVCRQRPSIEVLFNSAAKYAGRNALGVILTGMGSDGAHGLLNLKETGAFTIAQDEKSCVVYGMPKEAVKLNAAEKVVSLEKIPEALIRRLQAA
ncbi:chemotaxis response regulator protein-glutamate methylesterase [Candidatus Auribacterota bacterium]